MTDTFQLELTDDEGEIILSALEEDRESYKEAAREAYAEGDKTNGQTFGEAADRVTLVINKLKALLPDS